MGQEKNPILEEVAWLLDEMENRISGCKKAVRKLVSSGSEKRFIHRNWTVIKRISMSRNAQYLCHLLWGSRLYTNHYCLSLLDSKILYQSKSNSYWSQFSTNNWTQLSCWKCSPYDLTVSNVLLLSRCIMLIVHFRVSILIPVKPYGFYF